MIARARAGDVEQVPFGIVDFFKVGIVGNRLNAIQLWDDVVVAGHHHNLPEFQSLGKMHRADGNGASPEHNRTVGGAPRSKHRKRRPRPIGISLAGWFLVRAAGVFCLRERSE